MGDPTPADKLGITRRFNDLSKRVRTLERSVRRRLAVTSLFAAGDVSAGGDVTGANLAAFGSVGGTTVNASASMSAPSGTFPDALGSAGAYGNALTGTTRPLAVDASGQFGYVSSPARVKTNVQDAAHDPLKLLQVQARTYQYVAEIVERDRRAALPPDDPNDDPDYQVATNLGLIAEELEALDLGDLVFYNEDGTTAGVRYELIGLLALEAVQHVWTVVQQLLPPAEPTD